MQQDIIVLDDLNSETIVHHTPDIDIRNGETEGIKIIKVYVPEVGIVQMSFYFTDIFTVDENIENEND